MSEKKIFLKKILIFSQNIILNFQDGTSQPQARKKKEHPVKCSYIFPEKVFLYFGMNADQT